MDWSILHADIQAYIHSNVGKNINKLALHKNPFPESDWKEILNQIAAKSKAKEKLPSWFATSNIVYPAKISVEQTSSEKAASYKSDLVFGESLIDLTGGFGVDTFYFSKKLKEVVHCELNESLSAIVSHNFEQLDAKNIRCISGDSLETLLNLNRRFDWIYIDPSRRNDAKGKVFMLQDCLPNVPEHLDTYLQFADTILIKTAPILDLTAGLSELKHVKTIHIVGIENEVKELLWEIEKNYQGSVAIKTVNIAKKVQLFEFNSGDDVTPIAYGLPKKYLYEPNSAIMKSGGFDQVARAFDVEKLQQHSHLYTSDNCIDFPDRVFEIQKTLPYNKANMKQWMMNEKYNITTRNFAETVEDIRKKWKIMDGGDRYVFFTTDRNNDKIVLICTKINP